MLALWARWLRRPSPVSKMKRTGRCGRPALERLESRDVPSATVSGRAWADDGDGVRQPGEGG